MREERAEIKPLISVIMSVYNEEQYIREALQSLLDQTQQNFEIIIFDDCSSDNTVKIIKEFQDDRIFLHQNTENQGLTKNLNRGLKMARGKFIARMDGDDISLPDRFEVQLKYFDVHPDVYLISCQTRTFGAENLVWKLTDNPDKLKIMMLVRPVLAHPGYMMRRELVDMGYEYDESFRSAQDYDLAARVSRKYAIGIASPVLLHYRAHKGQVSSKSGEAQFINADRVRDFLLKELNIELNEAEKKYYHKLVQEIKTEEMEDFLQVKILLERILEANKNYKVYDNKKLKNTLYEILFTWVLRNKSVKIYMHIFQLCGKSFENIRIFFQTIIILARQKG